MPLALRDDARLLRPAVRAGWLEHGPRRAENRRGSEPFVEVSWDRALDLVANELHRVASEHGNSAIYGGSYGWASAGRFHHAQSQIHRFLAMNGGYTDSINSYSCAALEVILPHVIGGTPWSIFGWSPPWPELEEHCELIVAFGGLPLKNSQMNAGGVGRHSAGAWQRRCRAAGVDFVNVSALKTDAAEDINADWLPIRPNTDVALMLGLAHTMVIEGLHDRDFLDRCCVGFDRFEAYLRGNDGVEKNADWAARITQIDAETIRRLAKRIATRRTLISVAWSLQRADHGEQPYWMGITLAAMSGSLGRLGGGFGAGYGAEHAVGNWRDRSSVASLPRPHNPVMDYIPVARVTDMLLSPGTSFDYNGSRLTYPDTRLIYWCGGNPFHHQQDLNRLAAAWQRPETVVVHDAWWTPSAKFADIAIPIATSLERNDFAVGSGDPWLSPMHRAVNPPDGVPTDYEVFAALAQRLGFGREFTEGRTAEAWVEHLYEQTRLNVRQFGQELPPFESFWTGDSIELQSEAAEPHPFAPLRSDPMSNPLPTPSGRIEIFSETIESYGYDDCPAHPTWMPPAEWLGSELATTYPIHLISNQPKTRLHSQYDNGLASLESKVNGREPLTMNRDDAAERGIADGDTVRVFNSRGACLAGVCLSDEVRRGVAQLATGAWFDPQFPGEAGTLELHGNPNVLTRDKGTSKLAQGPTSMTVLVEIASTEGQHPSVTAFRPPQFVSGER
ncbi:molybdopterin-dependent oxidoreductase [Nocardioides sp. CN2-186]